MSQIKDVGILSKPLKSKPLLWNGPPLKVVSLGCGDKAHLDQCAVQDLGTAEIIFGSAHHLLEIADYPTSAKKRCFPSPFSEFRDLLGSHTGQRIVVLASGDALFYGVGNCLTRLIGSKNLIFRPHISSIQYCFHAIGLPWQKAEIVSLHGRPLISLRRHIQPYQLLAIFTDSESNPKAIASEMLDQGYRNAVIWVCEAMGQKSESVQQFSCAELAEYPSDFHELNICIIQLNQIGAKTDYPLPVFPGIQDAHFSTGAEPGFGMISKREVRLCVLTMMSPENNEIAWDIGAGCGSVSVEWARWNKLGQIYAIEESAERVDHIVTNSERFGTLLNLSPIQGSAPDCCDGLPEPDCIFIGGSNGLLEMLEFSWNRLADHGKLVASAVTEKSKLALKQFMDGKAGREWVEIQVTRNLPDSDINRELKSVVIAKCCKVSG